MYMVIQYSECVIMLLHQKMWVGLDFSEQFVSMHNEPIYKLLYIFCRFSEVDFL